MFEPRSGGNSVRACLGQRLPLFPTLWHKDVRLWVTLSVSPISSDRSHSVLKVAMMVEKSVIDNHLKACIIVGFDFLWIAGSSAQSHRPIIFASPDCLVERTFIIEIYLDNSLKSKKELTVPNYRNPLYVAKEYARMIEIGEARSEIDLARIIGISRARVVNLFTKLIKLETSILKLMEKLGDPLTSPIITERMLPPYVNDMKTKDALFKMTSATT